MLIFCNNPKSNGKILYRLSGKGTKMMVPSVHIIPRALCLWIHPHSSSGNVSNVVLQVNTLASSASLPFFCCSCPSSQSVFQRHCSCKSTASHAGVFTGATTAHSLLLAKKKNTKTQKNTVTEHIVRK